MYTSPLGDITFFAAAFCAGACIAFLYDIIRISRRIVPVNLSGVGIQDILFFAVSAAVLFFAAYTKNHGIIRWQGFLGCGLGVSAYAVLVRNRFVNLGTFLVKWLVKTLLWLLKAVLLPLRLVFRALKKPIDIIAWYTGARLRRVKRIAGCGKARLKMRLLSALSLVKKR